MTKRIVERETAPNESRGTEAPAVERTNREIVGLNAYVLDAIGRPMQTAEGDKISVKLGILMQLQAHQASASEGLMLLEHAIRLRASDESFHCSQTVFDVLKGIVEKNPSRFGALTHAQIWRAFL